MMQEAFFQAQVPGSAACPGHKALQKHSNVQQGGAGTSFDTSKEPSAILS